MSSFGKAAQVLFDPGDFSGIGSQGEIGDIQRRATDANIREIQRQFNAQNQRLEPFFQQSAPAINVLSQLAGVQGAGAQQQALDNLAVEPGQQFRQGELERSVIQNAAASGGLGGGNVLAQLQALGVQSRQQQLQDQFNRLAPVAGIADTAGQQLGQLGERFAAQTAQQLGQGAAAQAAGLAGQQQAKNNLLSTGLSIFGAIASDENIKTDVREMSNEECYNIVMNTEIKAWQYLSGMGPAGEHIGPMSQESHPCIKLEGKEALNLHNELWLIAGALKHFEEMMNG